MYPELGTHVYNPDIQKILLTEEKAICMNVARKHLENIM